MAEVELNTPRHPDSRLGSSKPLSRLEQMQANLHRKLLQEKEEKLVKLSNDSQEKTSARNKSGSSSLSRTNGGNVRKFFEERRAMENANLENSMTSLDSYLLNASNGLIARNNLKNSMTTQRPKKGSPIGWDKSYPLLPIERTNSGSSSGYESVSSQNKFSVASNTRRRVPHVRRQSLDRYDSKEENGNMRRSKSQILNGTLKDDPPKSQRGTLSPLRARSTVVKENRFVRDEEKRKLQQEMRRREQELINKIKEQQAEIERMRQEKIKEEKAQKARLYRKSVPNNHQPPPKPEQTFPHSESSPCVSGISSDNTPSSSPSSRNKHPPSSKKNQKVISSPPSSASSTKEVSKPMKSSSNSDLPECTVCGRRFAPDRLEKHMSICKKSKSKKRKVFDPRKMRTEGTEQEAFLKNKKNVPEVKPKKSNWRQKHENFLQTIRQAKLMQDHLAAGGKLSDLPPPPPLDTSDYIQCPHCGRKFSEAAAERHIPKCQSIRSNKK